MSSGGLAVIETHPIQYHAPVYRHLQQLGIPVTAIYGSDFSVAGYHDAEFGADFAWDTDLLAGYRSLFLSRVATGGALLAERMSTSGMAQALREVRPAAVLVTGYSPRFHRLALYHAVRSGRPVLFRGETTDHTRTGGHLRRWATDRFLRLAYGRCARLLYIGARSRRHFERFGCPEDKLVFSPYCVDVAPFACDEGARRRLRGGTRAALGFSRDHKVLLFSGKLVARKAPDLLLAAIRRLPPGPRALVGVVLLGDGELRSRLQDSARDLPAVEVRFVGFRNQGHLSPYYHAADVVVLPSVRGETLGLVANEALHHGVPCVVSDAVGCAPDLVEPGITGEVCAVGSADALAAAISRALRLGGPKVRAAARAKVEAFSVARAAAGVAAAFESAAK